METSDWSAGSQPVKDVWSYAMKENGALCVMTLLPTLMLKLSVDRLDFLPIVCGPLFVIGVDNLIIDCRQDHVVMKIYLFPKYRRSCNSTGSTWSRDWKNLVGRCPLPWH